MNSQYVNRIIRACKLDVNLYEEVEAAIAGNKAIGYTGKKGKECWKETEGPLSEREI